MPARRRLRLRHFDYHNPGAYFVTICSQNRVCLFGEPAGEGIRLSAAGLLIQTAWSEIPTSYQGVDIDAFVVMPNHLHGVIVLEKNADIGLSGVMQRFKTLTTSRYALGVKNEGWPRFTGRLWQRGFYDHVIRSVEDLDRVRRYIIENPGRWFDDRENPARRVTARRHP